MRLGLHGSLALEWVKKRSQSRSCRIAVEIIPRTTLHDPPVHTCNHLCRTQPLQDLRLMVDRDHAEAQRPVPENKIVNRLPDQLTIQPSKRLVQ